MNNANLLLPMIDLFALNLLAILAHQPQFDIEKARLPPLVVDAGQHAATTGPLPLHRMVLEIDGRARWQDEVVSTDSLPRRAADIVAKGERVALIIETEDGLGPVVALLQLQVRCSELGVWDRIDVAHVPPNSPQLNEGKSK